MSWFRREATVDDRDPQLPMEVHERVHSIPDAPYARSTVAFAPKPDDLVQATEWTRPVPVVTPRADPLTVPWTHEEPKQSGVYWFVGAGQMKVGQCVVIDFGGRLCVRESRADSVKYTSVGMLDRHWAGPIPIPEGYPLEAL